MARVNLPGSDNHPRRRPHTLLISIAHGDLRLAKYPLAIGHYHGDTIVHAEKLLDHQLGGRLTELFNMYLYPGPKETAEVIHVPRAEPPGALVIGLGDVGELQPSTVRDGVCNAALRHALAVLNEARNERAVTRGRGPASGGSAAAEGPLKTGFSSLLLGTYGGNSLSVEASLSAIIQGAARANEALRAQDLWSLVRIDEVQVIELYEDVALAAARAAAFLAKHPPAGFPEGDTLQVEPPYIRPIGKGRFQRPVDPYASGWWRRIRITSVQDEDGGQGNGAPPAAKKKEIGGLRFLALTDRARAEDTLQYTQRGFIEELVRRAVDSAAGADELATVLFKLLIPNSLKDQTRSEADMLLVLDAESSQYPWELLAERMRDDSIQPLALRMGLIRQFQTSEFTENPQPARGNYALVVGEPKSDQAPLPGARAEARAVAKLLHANGYLVGDVRRGEAPDAPLINPTSIELLNRLFARGYKIVHLAGHGEYVADDPAASGMMLDNGMCLSSSELRNLSPLPELVFINCCHLGRLDTGAAKLRTNAPHRLAASISQQLINMGVKAVVAAGWAVDDGAATRFAQVFYEEMLRGQKFGAAVKAARIAAYEAAPNSNTWGAYQCYGNPDFVLNQQGDAGPRSTDPRCYTRSEYLERLADIASDAADVDEAGAEALRRQLASLTRDIPQMWRDGEVLSAFGHAWAALRDYEEAIACYAETRGEETGRVPLKSVEQLASSRIKWAESLGPSEQADALIEEAVKDLNWLLEYGPTAERLSLLGACYKRRAGFARTAAEKRKWLRTARDYYGRAHEWHREKKGGVDAYPALNWLAYRILLGEQLGEDDLRLIEECKAPAQAGAAREPGFWDRVHEADAEVVRHLSLGDLGEHVEAGDDLAGLYRRAFDLGASPRDRAAVINHLRFLGDMLSKVGRQDERRQSDLEGLRRLHQLLAPADAG